VDGAEGPGLKGAPVMLALVASIHVLNSGPEQQRRGWSGQARP
jgi:hypothetical protein